MLFNNRIFPFVVLFVSLIVAIYFYDENYNNIEEDFSYNLKNWFNKGKYFNYKNQHKIFYVHEQLKNSKLVNEEDKVSVLFLHGFPTSSYDYYKIWNLFTADYLNENLNLNKNISSIVTFDYLGYGFSDKPLDYEYNIFDMADLAEHLILHLHIRTLVLIAHDVGDTVAAEIIRRDNLKNRNHFKLVKAVLLNGGIITSVYKPILSQKVLRASPLNFVFAKYLFKSILFQHSFKQVFGQFNQPNSTDLKDFYYTIKYNKGNQVLPLTIEYMTEREQYGDVWYDALNETSLPLMFIYGPADPINPYSTFPQKLKTDIPKIKLMVLSDLVGHYPQYEDSFTVFELIKSFLLK